MKDTPYPTFISELRAIFHEFYKDIYKILQNNCTSYVVLIWYADLEKINVIGQTKVSEY